MPHCILLTLNILKPFIPLLYLKTYSFSTLSRITAAGQKIPSRTSQRVVLEGQQIEQDLTFAVASSSLSFLLKQHSATTNNIRSLDLSLEIRKKDICKAQASRSVQPPTPAPADRQSASKKGRV